MSLLLVHPPVVKPCEPPAGIAKLSGALKQAGIGSDLWDANLECLAHFLQKPLSPTDTWTRRALRHRSHHLWVLKDRSSYRDLSRYKRAVNDLNRILRMGLSSPRFRLGLGNYEDARLSPTQSADLLRSAEDPEDSPFYSYFRERFLSIAEHTQPSVVGFSLNFLSQALATFPMIGYLKKHCPGVRVVLGGGLITSWMRRPNWPNPFQGLADFLVTGPGEGPLLSILGIRGIHPREVPVPQYDSFPTQGYLAPGFILPYGASSGCYWNRCSFCPEKAEGNPYLPIPDDRVIADLKSLVEKTKPVLIHLLDNALRPSLLGKITENPPGAPWYGFARMTAHLADPDFCLALKRSGCTMLQLGLESGDQGVLDALYKGIDLGVASRVLKNLTQAGIATYVYLLFGTPPETQKEARRTLEFVVHHHEQIRFLNLALFNLPVGVQGWEVPAREFGEGDLSLYRSFVHPRGWERNQVRQFLDKEFKRHPAIAAIVRRDPPVFTSNHAPFFSW